MRLIFLVLSLFLVAPDTVAQVGKAPWEEYVKRLKASEEVSALGPNLFGDQVSLSNGALSFSVTDVSLPGNSGLPVALTRTYRVQDWRHRLADGMMLDWDLDVPSLSAVHAGPWVAHGGGTDRCTNPGPPPSPTQYPGLHAIDFWQGAQLNLPGVSSGELLTPVAGAPQPTTGGPYYWMTNDQVHFSCLSTIENGTGQGFLAITPDGTRIWFNHMAQHHEPWLRRGSQTVIQGGAPLEYQAHIIRNVLLATRVEDRFGNWVTYTYTNSATQRARLTQIASNDGRQLTLAYNGQGAVSSVSDGTRTWTYSYGSTSSGRPTLTQVNLPDSSKWTINLAAFTNAEILQTENFMFDEIYRTCIFNETPLNDSNQPVGTMTHPSGATGTFTLFLREHGRSQVPVTCSNYTTGGSANNPNDDVPFFPIRYWAYSLKTKSITGPGMVAAAWNYQYSSQGGLVYQAGATPQYPVCDTSQWMACITPPCQSDLCAGRSTTVVTGPGGRWTRYKHGNTFQYDEGKLISVEEGSSDTNILRSTVYTYDLAKDEPAGHPYLRRWGHGQRGNGDSVQSEYHRPLVKTVIEQDAGLFVWEVPTGCSATYPASYCMDNLARPIRVVRSGTVSTAATGENPVIAPSLVPTLTVPASSSTGSYSASWTAVPLASSYQLREMLGTGSWSTIHSGSATSKAVSGRATGSWNYQVRACNVAGCGAWSGTRTTIVTLPPAGAPTLTAPASNTTGSYTVSWTAVGGATRYELDQRKDAGAWSNIHNASATSKALTGQTPGTYGHRVRACNTGGCGPYSAISSTTVSSQPLGAPALTAPATVYSGDAFTVSWTSISGATQYVLERNRNGGAFMVLYDGAATSTSQTAGLLGTYRYRVKACNSSGCGPMSGDRIVTVQGESLMQSQDSEAPSFEGDAGEGGE